MKRITEDSGYLKKNNNNTLFQNPTPNKNSKNEQNLQCNSINNANLIDNNSKVLGDTNSNFVSPSKKVRIQNKNKMIKFNEALLHLSKGETIEIPKAYPIFDTLGERPNFKKLEEMIKSSNGEFQYPIYSVNSLSTLNDKVKDKKTGIAILRFVLKTNSELVFAPNDVACPQKGTPAHFQLTGQSQDSANVTAAGEISLTNGKISGIRNKSGNFHPNFDSLQWALAALLVSKVEFCESILIEDLNSRNFLVNVEDLKKELSEKFSEALLKEFKNSNENYYPIPVTYGTPKPTTFNLSRPSFSYQPTKFNKEDKKLSQKFEDCLASEEGEDFLFDEDSTESTSTKTGNEIRGKKLAF